jgi:hypothetical protein
MNESTEISIASSDGHAQPIGCPLVQGHASPDSTDFRILELELENSRLQRLVAELLLKNQQLRKSET